MQNSEEVKPHPARELPLPELNQIITPQKKIISRDHEPIFIESMLHFNSGPQRRSGLKLALLNWTSALIDSLVLVSLSCFVMITLSLLMKTSAGQVMKFILTDQGVLGIFLFSFALSYWAYLVLSRLLMGASLGEWTCDLRLGQPVERLRPDYAFKVMLRTTLIFSTGLFLLPLLSALFRRDLAGEICGVKIYSLV